MVAYRNGKSLGGLVVAPMLREQKLCPPSKQKWWVVEETRKQLFKTKKQENKASTSSIFGSFTIHVSSILYPSVSKTHGNPGPSSSRPQTRDSKDPVASPSTQSADHGARSPTQSERLKDKPPRPRGPRFRWTCGPKRVIEIAGSCRFLALNQSRQTLDSPNI